MLKTRSLPLILLLALLATPALAKSDSDKAQASDAHRIDVPLNDLKNFAEIFERIKRNYVEETSDHELIKYAIKGMLSGLDPHSAYLDADDFRDLQVGTRGEFGGLGIEVGEENGYIKVIAPMDDTPAAKAGVKAGDLIVRIDGKPLKDMPLNDAVNMMRGKPGSKIELTILRDGEDKPLSITVIRDIIRVRSVKGRLLQKDFAYIRLAQFQSHTAQDMLEKLSQLKKQNKGPLKGLVLDLRNNPGGVLTGAVAVSDAFLKDGIVVYTEGRDKDSRLNFKAAPDDVLKGEPLVVLVNGGSASASEIVAGALQDHGRAVIMGERTFGKGSVQTIVPIDERTGIKLTTARYYTPKGRSIQAEGITPDIPLEQVKLTKKENTSVSRLKEADLARHLNKGDKASNKKTATDKPESLANLYLQDYQVAEALNLLKGMYLLQKRGSVAKAAQ
ncbi:MAG TPA: S41 family peptidase [Chromatiaceae bacterium]|nr:S41 family peptidase [Chromatiaceae bacterium]